MADPSFEASDRILGNSAKKSGDEVDGKRVGPDKGQDEADQHSPASVYEIERSRNGPVGHHKTVFSDKVENRFVQIPDKPHKEVNQDQIVTMIKK